MFAVGMVLLASAFGQIDVSPPRKAILAVPDALAVSEQNEFVHRCVPWCPASAGLLVRLKADPTYV